MRKMPSRRRTLAPDSRIRQFRAREGDHSRCCDICRARRDAGGRSVERASAPVRCGVPQHRLRLPLGRPVHRRPEARDEALAQICPQEASADLASPAVQPQRIAQAAARRLDRFRSLHSERGAAPVSAAASPATCTRYRVTRRRWKKVRIQYFPGSSQRGRGRRASPDNCLPPSGNCRAPP